ncbi:MAG: hypothetical protein AB8G99_19165, partial [Planctomycetaceae bacterium]
EMLGFGWSAESERRERVLVEMLRRGDREFKPALQRLVADYKARREELQRTITRLEPLQPKDRRAWNEMTQAELDLSDEFYRVQSDFREAAPRIELLTALRRLQGKPDPVHVVVTGLSRGSYPLQWPEMPTAHVSVRNIDTLQEPVRSQLGGNNRSGRAERFKIQVRNTRTGEVTQETLPPPSMFSGGRLGGTTLEFGEGWHTSLPLADFVPQLQPGDYAVRVLYHDHQCIADHDSTEDLICCQSREYELIIEERTVRQTEEEAAAMATLLTQLDRSQHIRIVEGPYGEWAHDFIPPESVLGQILTTGWKAVPALLDELENESQTLAERAHTLAILFSITGQVDPRGEAIIMGHHIPTHKSPIGPFAYIRPGKGVSHHMDGELTGSAGSFGFGSLRRVGLPKPESEHLKDTTVSTTPLNDPEAIDAMKALIAMQPPRPAMELDGEAQAVLIAEWRQLRKLITVVTPKN